MWTTAIYFITPLYELILAEISASWKLCRLYLLRAEVRTTSIYIFMPLYELFGRNFGH